MDEMTCPQCQTAMTAREVSGVTVQQCPACEGVFLPRAELGSLVDAENDWHRGSGPVTQPMPRITEDMVAPPSPPAQTRARAWVETLFG
ncbi:MAG: zf-TFIIB domain-containing protein [Nocardioidaceae bacterium]